jgi:hypothetical protein
MLFAADALNPASQIGRRFLPQKNLNVLLQTVGEELSTLLKFAP